MQKDYLQLSSCPCPFLHDGEVGRRDLLWHKYSFIPCVEFKSRFCPRGIACDCAHGILEQRFHPMLFRARYCWYMTTCKRKDCSLAHKEEEIRVPTIAPNVTYPRSSQPDSVVLSDIFSNISNALNPTDFPTSHSLWNNPIPDCSSKFETTSRLVLEPRVKAKTININGDQSGEKPSYSLMKHVSRESSMNNSVQQNTLNQPDFSWAHFLVEDDGNLKPTGLIGEPNFEEQQHNTDQ